MGVKKRDAQRRWWRISIVTGIIILIAALLTSKTNSLSGVQDCHDWAPVESLIPPVQSYEFDSTEWNTLDVVDFELDSNLSKEEIRLSWNNFTKGKSKIIYISPLKSIISILHKRLNELSESLKINCKIEKRTGDVSYTLKKKQLLKMELKFLI